MELTTIRLYTIPLPGCLMIKPTQRSNILPFSPAGQIEQSNEEDASEKQWHCCEGHVGDKSASPEGKPKDRLTKCTKFC